MAGKRLIGQKSKKAHQARFRQGTMADIRYVVSLMIVVKRQSRHCLDVA